jgi:hypothetical protein
MIGLLLRSLHLQDWVVFVVIYGLYAFWALWTVGFGYAHDITGWRHPGRPSRMHRLLFQVHTGLHLDPKRTYGDEAKLKKTAGDTTRATPEGLAVYWTTTTRWQRAIRNNALVATWLTAWCGIIIDPVDTLRAIVWLICAALVLFVVHFTRKARRRHIRKHPIGKPAISMTGKAKAVFSHDEQTVENKARLTVTEEPQLESEVPVGVLATLLADQMGASPAEVERGLRLTPERGELRLPDRYPALVKQRGQVEEVLEAHTDGRVRFRWSTTTNPRMLTWHPIVSGLPAAATFRDYLTDIEGLVRGKYAVGVQEDKSVYVTSHNGDTPWHLRAADSGTGKSTGFLVKAAQICHNDPWADLYCIDTKQVSFEYLRGIPGVHVYDNPESEMDKIWDVFYILEDMLRKRYTAIRTGQKRPEDFNDIWVLVDEGNDLSGNLKSYYKRFKMPTGGPVTPPIWSEAIAPLLRLGRQANMRGEMMFQDVTDKALGGESLKAAFGVFGMSISKKGQWDRIVGPPAPSFQTGPGRICMVKGSEQTWVQGFYDDSQFLHDYALENRKGRAAA